LCDRSAFFLVWALYILLLAFRRLRAGRGFAVLAALAGVMYDLGEEPGWI
jgi:hypothetical protein